MSWSFVGSVVTGNVAGATGSAGNVTLPASVNGGDLIVFASIYASIPAGTTTLPGFTFLQNNAGTQASGEDQFLLAYRVAAGAAGSATTDSTFTVTFSQTTWGAWLVYVWRSTIGVLVSGITSNEYHAAAGYVTALPDATLTVPAGSLGIWGYGGCDSGFSGSPALSGTATTTLTNWNTQNSTGAGGVVGMGWGTSQGAPGGATSSIALDPTDFAVQVPEGVPASGIASWPARPGLSRLRHHHGVWRQQIQQVFQPGNANPVAGLATGTGVALGQDTDTSLTFAADVQPNAGLATGTGAGLGQDDSTEFVTIAVTGLATGSGSGQPPGMAQAQLATGTGTAQQPAVTIAAAARLATGTSESQGQDNDTSGTLVSVGVTGLATGTGGAPPPGEAQAQLATGTGAAPQVTPLVAPAAGLASGTGTAQQPAVTIAAAAGLATGTGAAPQPTAWVEPGGGLASGGGTGGQAGGQNAQLATATGAALQPSVSTSGSTNANAGLATGTGTAQQPIPDVQPGGGLAAGAGIAPQAGGQNAGLATGTAAAQQPVPLVQPAAGLATGTAAARQPVPLISTGAGLAAGTGAALPTAFDYVLVVLATGTGAAPQPTVIAATAVVKGYATGTLGETAAMTAAVREAAAMTAILGEAAGMTAATGETAAMAAAVSQASPSTRSGVS